VLHHLLDRGLTRLVQLAASATTRESATTPTNSAEATAASVSSVADKGTAGHSAVSCPWSVRVWVHFVYQPILPVETHLCVSFDANRIGERSNVRIMQWSGVLSLDESALRFDYKPKGK
jgi:hypothetical protein